MALPYPDFYDVTYSYTGFQQAQGDNSFPGTQLDADLAGLQDSIENIIAFAKGVMRSDGALKNQVVTYDSLSAALQTAGIAPALPWLTATFYATNVSVINNGNLYRALRDHTSGVFATDLAAGKWLLITALPTAAIPDQATIATLTATTISVAQLYVDVAGYYTAGAGGAHRRVRDGSGDITSVDGAKWQVAEKEPNVLMFGALSGGTAAVNTAAFLRAQAYCEANGIAKCCVPAGSYTVEKTTGTEIFKPSGMFVFVGDSAVTTAIYASAATPRTVDVFRVTPLTGSPLFWGFTDLAIYAIDGGRDAVNIDLSTTTHLSHTVLDRCVLRGSGVSDGAGETGKGLRIGKDISTGDYDGFFTSTLNANVFVNGVKIVNGGDSVIIRGGGVSGVGIGIYMSSVPGAAACQFDGVNNTAAGGQYYFKDVQNATIRGGQIETPGTYNGADNAQVVFDNCNNCKVLDSSINPVGLAIDNVLMKGGSQNCYVAGNHQVVTAGRAHLKLAADCGARNRLDARGYFLVDASPQSNPVVNDLTTGLSILPWFIDMAESGAAAPESNRGRLYFKLDTGATRVAFINHAGTERILTDRTSTETLSGKSLTAPVIAGGNHTAMTTMGLRSTGAAFDLQMATAEAITAARQINWVVNNADRAITLAGNLSFGGAFAISGAFGTTFTVTGTTTVTFPTTGTLATRAGAETLSSKTLAAPIITGLIDASAASAGQIKFAAAQNPSADVNTLDDYEEGTWTPTLTYVTPGDLAVAYTTQIGRYTKIGNVVTWSCDIQTSAFTFTTASGGLLITGLPFTSFNGAQNGRVGCLWQGVTKAGFTDAILGIAPNETQLRGSICGSAQTASLITAADTPTAGTMRFSASGNYFAAN